MKLLKNLLRAFKKIKVFLTLCFSVLLFSCGGGGGNTSAPSPNPQTSNLSFSSKQEIKNQKLSYNINNFYMNDSISRASETMANCTHEILNKAKAS